MKIDGKKKILLSVIILLLFIYKLKQNIARAISVWIRYVDPYKLTYFMDKN